MILHWRSPLIFAHRGASAHASENTIAAFEFAIQMKADVIELDAKLAADEQAVVIHDPTVDRNTDDSGKVNNIPLAHCANWMPVLILGRSFSMSLSPR